MIWVVILYVQWVWGSVNHLTSLASPIKLYGGTQGSDPKREWNSHMALYKKREKFISIRETEHAEPKSKSKPQEKTKKGEVAK